MINTIITIGTLLIVVVSLIIIARVAMQAVNTVLAKIAALQVTTNAIELHVGNAATQAQSTIDAMRQQINALQETVRDNKEIASQLAKKLLPAIDNANLSAEMEKNTTATVANTDRTQVLVDELKKKE